MTPETEKILQEIGDDQRKELDARINRTIETFLKDHGLNPNRAKEIQIDVEQDDERGTP